MMSQISATVNIIKTVFLNLSFGNFDVTVSAVTMGDAMVTVICERLHDVRTNCFVSRRLQGGVGKRTTNVHKQNFISVIIVKI